MKTKSMVLAGAVFLAAPLAATESADPEPVVSLWTNHDDVIPRGQRVRVFFQTSDDAYVTVFRIDTDGRVSVLFPLGPWDHAFARGNRRYEVRFYSGRYAFTANDYPGEGYIFATASPYPFEYRSLAAGTRWHYENVGYDGRVVGDPYVAVMDLIDQISPAAAPHPAYDIMPYYVDQRVDYPRFVCYDCHQYVRYTAWNPYRDPCYAFRLVIYDDPSYYPARIREGTRVVFARSNRLEPRFVFRERIAQKPAIAGQRRRPENRTTPRYAPDRGETSRSVGGVGNVPAPRGRGGEQGRATHRPERREATRSPSVMPQPAPARAAPSPGRLEDRDVRRPARSRAGSQRHIDPRLTPRKPAVRRRPPG